MKKLNMLYGTTSLRRLRYLHGYTVQQMADMIPCSTRTVNRIEQDNRTSNEGIAEKIAKIFCIPFRQLFIKVEQHLLDELERVAPEVQCGKLLDGEIYYLVYMCRVSWREAQIWGKTMWIRNYDANHELRKLRRLGENAQIARYLKGVPVINCQDDWDGFFYRVWIGSCHELIVSEKCLQRCAPYVLDTYAVHRTILQKGELTDDGDVILLGQYKNRSGVFLVRDTTANAGS